MRVAGFSKNKTSISAGLIALVAMVNIGGAQGQTAAPAVATATGAGTAATAAEKAKSAPQKSVTAPAAAKGRECTRLPLSDIQVGKDKTIEVARLRLDEYIAKVGKQRGWKSWDKSQETVSCEDYLNVPFLGQEYKCLVTATFCKKN